MNPLDFIQSCLILTVSTMFLHHRGYGVVHSILLQAVWIMAAVGAWFVVVLA